MTRACFFAVLQLAHGFEDVIWLLAAINIKY